MMNQDIHSIAAILVLPFNFNLILFKARAYLDLKQRKDNGETVDSNDIKKHKKDVLRIASELMLEKVTNLPNTVKKILILLLIPWKKNNLMIIH